MYIWLEPAVAAIPRDCPQALALIVLPDALVTATIHSTTPRCQDIVFGADYSTGFEHHDLPLLLLDCFHRNAIAEINTKRLSRCARQYQAIVCASSGYHQPPTTSEPNPG